MSKPSLELTASIGGPSGRRWRYAPAAKDAGDRPLDLSFTTEAGEGFATGQLTLSRPYDQDSPDLGLLGDVVIEGYDGQIAYEGRVRGTPRSLSGQGPQIRMDLEGWMSHARQQPFVDLIIDRDLSQWKDLSPYNQARFRSAGYTGPFIGPSADEGQVISTITRIAQPGSLGVVAGAQYESPVPIGRILIVIQEVVTSSGWGQWVETSTDSSLGDNSENVGTRDGNGDLDFYPTKNPRFADVTMRYGAAYTGDGMWVFRFIPVVFGTSGLPVSGSRDQSRVGLSDAMRYLLGKYAPKLDLSRMVNNGFPVAHAVWREPVTCHDAIRELNVYSQWALGVYENRQVEYRPFDLAAYDWQVRAGQDGVEVETQGVTIEGAFNGVTVSWPDYAGGQNTLTPDDTTELRDSNPAIAANQWGDRQWANLSLSRMTSQEGAITQARLYLADLNRPKFPSTITVPGHIKDSRGHWQPAWRVRANQTISIRNHPNDAPRLITSTSWQGNRLQITTDNALNRFEAITARLDRARADKGM